MENEFESRPGLVGFAVVAVALSHFSSEYVHAEQAYYNYKYPNKRVK
jgi:hypothetical protein